MWLLLAVLASAPTFATPPRLPLDADWQCPMSVEALSDDHFVVRNPRGDTLSAYDFGRLVGDSATLVPVDRAGKIRVAVGVGLIAVGALGGLGTTVALGNDDLSYVAGGAMLVGFAAGGLYVLVNKKSRRVDRYWTHFDAEWLRHDCGKVAEGHEDRASLDVRIGVHARGIGVAVRF